MTVLGLDAAMLVVAVLVAWAGFPVALVMWLLLGAVVVPRLARWATDVVCGKDDR